ncbi:MAG: chemotaxis protein CheA [Magnetospirillum sp.]|nr:chemotaxis protein CheA [Magnetospirillum sp.]
MTMIDPAATFRSEAQDLFEELERALLDLEAAPDRRDLVDTAFRALHTLKGSGSMFGYDRVAAFAHHLETAFDRVRKGEIPPDRELVAAALSAQDCLRRLIEQPDRDSGDEAGILARLEAVAGPAAAGVGMGAAPSGGGEGPVTYRIRFRLAPDAVAMGNNPLLMLDELRSLGSCTAVAIDDDVPPLEIIDPTQLHLRWDVVLTTERPHSVIDDVFIFVRDGMELEVTRIDGEAGPRRLGEILVERGDVSLAALEGALARQEPLGRILVKEGVVSEEVVVAALAEQQHLRQEAEATRTAAKEQVTIRVAADRLDGLMDRVGELVIAQARLKQLANALDDAAMKSAAEEIERLASDLRETTMGIRMVPIGTLFGRFRRLVHDLARDLGKEVRLSTAGEETELDKTVIERLADPMIHLIRNAIDHGLEDAAIRGGAGKTAEGEILLSAVHSGAQVLIRVRDDGRGLDRARIRAKAEEQGLIAPDAKLSDAELFQVIFHPGFSTANGVTSLSGRGVGMDVVKRTIDGLRGNVEVASTPGRGTEITLRLPLTLAIIDGLLVRVGKGQYVIPLSAVEECVELTVEEDLRHTGRNFLNIRGDLVPFVRLRETFRSTLPADRYQKVVVVSAGERRVGLVVDQVIGDHQTVIKSLSQLHADVESFSGATILGDGTVALIFDVGHLVAQGQTTEVQRQAS